MNAHRCRIYDMACHQRQQFDDKTLSRRLGAIVPANEALLTLNTKRSWELYGLGSQDSPLRPGVDVMATSQGL